MISITPSGMVVAVLAIIALVFTWRFLRSTRLRARQYIRQVQECGYLPPPPTPRAVRRLLRLSRLLTFIQVGRVKIIGRENLEKADGPYIVTPNHPHWADVVTLPLLMNGPARYMAAQGVFTAGCGLGGLLVAPMGAFSVDLTKGKGAPAKDAAVRVLTTGQRLVMFPEGWAYLDGKLGDLKKGAVRIAREASRQLGKPTYIIPVHLRYGKYPGSWIRKLPPALEYLLVFALFVVFRRGLTMVVGEPMAIDSFSANDDEATQQLRKAIVSLDSANPKAA